MWRATCSGDKPFCAADDAVAGGWRCVAKNDETVMFKMECLTKSDCAAGLACCSGMFTRCASEAECSGGGDTPLIACATEADCPESWYGMPVLGCKAMEDAMPGLNVCNVQ